MNLGLHLGQTLKRNQAERFLIPENGSLGGGRASALRREGRVWMELPELTPGAQMSPVVLPQGLTYFRGPNSTSSV